MADIMKDDVRTYVKKLILKEFRSNNYERKVLPDNLKTIAGEHRDGQCRPLCNYPFMEE